jgi:hypothetical protein
MWRSNYMGCISRLQAAPWVEHGPSVALRFDLSGTLRAVGKITRARWHPTPAQRAFLADVIDVAFG